jgi:hypothetical protein
MVDIDKIKERKSKKKRGNEDDVEKVKKAKKNKKDGRKKKTGSAKKTGDGDIKNLMFVIGNMYLYPNTMAGFAKKKLSGKGKKILDDVSKDISSEMLDFMGVFGVEEIGNNYGYEFEEISDQISNGDKYGKSYPTKESKAKRSDVKDLLDCIANGMLFVEGIMRRDDDDGESNFRDKKSAEIAELMYDEFKDIISTLGVQRIAEKYGYSWKEDIIKGVLEDQDYDELIESKWG